MEMVSNKIKSSMYTRGSLSMNKDGISVSNIVHHEIDVMTCLVAIKTENDLEEVLLKHTLAESYLL